MSPLLSLERVSMSLFRDMELILITRRTSLTTLVEGLRILTVMKPNLSSEIQKPTVNLVRLLKTTLIIKLTNILISILKFQVNIPTLKQNNLSLILVSTFQIRTLEKQKVKPLIQVGETPKVSELSIFKI
jgi:hypothetical protein